MPGQTSSTFEIGTHKYKIDRYADSVGAVKRPVVVVVHGVDGMDGESGIEIRKFAGEIAGQGFIVFTPHYFDVNDGADTLPLTELFARRVPRVGSYPPRIAAAVDYALKQSDADRGRLGLIGLSLGGGLVLDYAESAPAGSVKAIVDFFGYIPDPKIYANASRLPPTLILHNKNDGIVKVINSSQPLLDSLDKTKVPHDHCFYDDHNLARGHHPFLPGGAADLDSRSRSLTWLKTYIKPSS